MATKIKYGPANAKFLLLLACLLYLRCTLSGQAQFKSFAFEQSGDRKVSLDFREVQNLIVLPLFLNNSDTLWFILDSGVKNTILFELPSNDTLHMKGTRTLKLGGLGMGREINVLHTWDNKVRIPGIVAHNQDVLVVQDSVFSIANHLGFPVHGIIGHALFKDFVVRVNYPLRSVSFYDPEQFSSWWKGYRMNIQIMDRKPYINVPIQFNSGQRAVFKLLLDTGAGLSAAIFLDSTSEIDIPEPNIHGSLGSGLSGRLYGKMARVNYVQIGKFQIDEPILTFPDSQSVNKKRKPNYHMGIVGSDILKRFNCYISYYHQAIWLRRNRYFNDRFKYNTAGIDVLTPYPSLPIYMVEHVRPGSAADDAGVQSGDQIITIEKRSAYNMSLDDVADHFYQKPGSKVNLTVKRDTTLLEYQLKLKGKL